MVIVSFRLAFSKTTIDLSGFNFTDLLSLILAISAIGLSAAFYFKADESAKSFYDNSFNFTRHMSETLGRIEERFGERLKNIDEGYSGLSRKFDSFPLDLKAAREGEQRTEDAVDAREAEYKQILDELMQKAQLADDEKEAMSKRLSSVGAELDAARSELASYKDSIRNANKILEMDDGLFTWLRDFVREVYDKSFLDKTLTDIGNVFQGLYRRGHFPSHIERELMSSGMLNDGSLTLRGVKQLRQFIRSEFN